MKKKKSIIDVANATYSMKPSSSNTTATISLPSPHRSSGDARIDRNDYIGKGISERSHPTNRTSSNSRLDDRLDAARTMLGISPCSVTDGSIGTILGEIETRTYSKFKVESIPIQDQQQQRQQQPQQRQHYRKDQDRHNFEIPSYSSSAMATNEYSNSSPSPLQVPSPLLLPSSRRSRSNSAGLDALAFCATQEQEVSESIMSSSDLPSPKIVVPNPVTSSSDDDSDIMPPPPPRTVASAAASTASISNNANVKMSRRRSVSNPEGMDKWGTKRLRLVLPASIIEEEIAEANAAIMNAKKQKSAASAAAALIKNKSPSLVSRSSTPSLSISKANSQSSNNETIPSRYLGEDDKNLDHDQLLRRARSRLLEDLSQSSIASGEKGMLTLPHSLEKYKEVYNKNGRIGIYTPAERAAIIARFQKKRKSRVWNKKIRYNCRKNLADRRLRIKGRFVKRSTPLPSPQSIDNVSNSISTATKQNADVTAAATDSISGNKSTVKDQGGKGSTKIVKGNADTATSSGITLATKSIADGTELIANYEHDTETEMPDVNDPDAGFCPTDDQPYRRLRRHTIT